MSGASMKQALNGGAGISAEDKARFFRAKQAESYAFKVRYAETRAWEFYNHPEIAGSCCVSVGGLDSITLLLFLRSIGIDVPAVSVSVLEDKSIQDVHRQLGVIPLKPIKSKVEVIREFGWPVLSKEIAGKISLLQHPSEKNATVRHAIITGETGAYGGYRKGTRTGPCGPQRPSGPGAACAALASTWRSAPTGLTGSGRGAPGSGRCGCTT